MYGLSNDIFFLWNNYYNLIVMRKGNMESGEGGTAVDSVGL